VITQTYVPAKDGDHLIMVLTVLDVLKSQAGCGCGWRVHGRPLKVWARVYEHQEQHRSHN
jgi:hypothetical protein